MFWIALELSIPKIGFNITLSLTVKKVDAFKFDGVAESDNTVTWHNLFWSIQCRGFYTLTLEKYNLKIMKMHSMHEHPDFSVKTGELHKYKMTIHRILGGLLK